MRPGDFQSNIEHLAGTLKQQGPMVSNAIKTQRTQLFIDPADPELEDDGKTVRMATKKRTMSFKHQYEKYLKDSSDWENCNGQIFEEFISHCTPIIKTKLKSLIGQSNRCSASSRQ